MKHELPKIKDMEPGDFKNNDYLLRMVEKLNRDGAGIVLGTQLGPQQFALVAHFRHELLRHRVHGPGGGAL
mgnify:CR=1 FL=1